MHKLYTIQSSLQNDVHGIQIMDAICINTGDLT